MAGKGKGRNSGGEDKGRHGGDKERDNSISCEIDLFYFLPEGCIATVISLTTPQDACRLGSVSKIFKSAADSDAVWEGFLPSDYRDVLERCCVDGVDILSSLSKKQLFRHLVHRPILVDGHTKSFSLERSSGKKCYTIAARELLVVWGDTPRYWTWRPAPQSRFPEVAELITVCWFEVRGYIKTSLLSPDTNYAAYFVFKMLEETYGFYRPADVSVTTAGGKEIRSVYLDPHEGHYRRNQAQQARRRGVFNRLRSITGMQPSMQREEDDKHPKQRPDGWLEIEIGEFWSRRDEDEEVEMIVLDNKGGNWKGGLVLEGIEIRPKAVSAP